MSQARQRYAQHQYLSQRRNGTHEHWLTQTCILGAMSGCVFSKSSSMIQWCQSEWCCAQHQREQFMKPPTGCLLEVTQWCNDSKPVALCAAPTTIPEASNLQLGCHWWLTHWCCNDVKPVALCPAPTWTIHEASNLQLGCHWWLINDAMMSNRRRYAQRQHEQFLRPPIYKLGVTDGKALMQWCQTGALCTAPTWTIHEVSNLQLGCHWWLSTDAAAMMSSWWRYAQRQDPEFLRHPIYNSGVRTRQCQTSGAMRNTNPDQEFIRQPMFNLCATDGLLWKMQYPKDPSVIKCYGAVIRSIYNGRSFGYPYHFPWENKHFEQFL